MVKFFKDGNDNWHIGDSIWNKSGNWSRHYPGKDKSCVYVKNGLVTVISSLVTDIEKNEQGDKYSSFEEFDTAVAPFFVKAPGGGGDESIDLTDIPGWDPSKDIILLSSSGVLNWIER